MTKFNFDTYLIQLKADIKAMAVDEWADYKDAVLDDGRALLRLTQSDLERWGALVACKELTSDDLHWLVKGKMDAAELCALKEKGLTKVRIEKFRNSVVSLVVGSLVKATLK
jgi:hypothetical protein